VKTYTKQQVHDAMNRLCGVKYSHREMINGKDSFIYDSNKSNLKVIVDLETGAFCGYELDSKKNVPPFGMVYCIKGM